MTRTRVFVVDDHKVFTDVLTAAIDAEADLRCTAVAGTADVARQRGGFVPFDVAIVDAHLPDGDGLEVAADLMTLAPHARVIVLTAFPKPSTMARARELGVAGFFSKDATLRDLLAAVRNATPERPVFHAPAGAAEHPRLTGREQDVLRLLAEAHSVHDISALLGVSTNTAREHVRGVLQKLGAHSQLEAVVIAARAGLVNVGRS